MNSVSQLSELEQTSIHPSDGCVDSNRFDWRTGGTVLPDLFTIPDADGLVNHPGSHVVSVASMARPQARQEAMARLDYCDSRRPVVDHHSGGVAAEFVCRHHS